MQNPYYVNQFIIDLKSPILPTPNGLKLALYQYQAAALHALCAIENERRYDLSQTVAASIGVQPLHLSSITNKHIVVTTDAAWLKFRFGSGKTIIILAWILTPPKKLFWPRGHMPTVTAQRCNVVVKYPRVAPFTIVCVGKAVFSQWIASIENFTSLSLFPIYDVYTLRQFR
jgi:hypothetical protein